jgi:D-alanyl-D-alanine carboxypeptidase/D-alanyl-D-alanine-endopeptidase (penicillin-binding protein 4)
MDTSNYGRPGFTFCILYFTFHISSCSVQKQIARSAKETVLNAPALQTAHVGISIYEPATNKYWYNYQDEHYFVPASNTKIPTCYAAMKYLGDSLVGLRYGIPEEQAQKDKLIVIQPTGDPTFLHADYAKQPAFDFLEKKFNRTKMEMGWMDTAWKEERWGSGWSWNDYEEPYMAERSPLPIYGNTMTISLNDVKDRNASDTDYYIRKVRLFKTGVVYFDSLVNQGRILFSKRLLNNPTQYLTISRSLEYNWFDIAPADNPFSSVTMNFATRGPTTALEILEQTFNKKFGYVSPSGPVNSYFNESYNSDGSTITINRWFKIHSQPTDSLLKPMMHRSDNFFAEQSLLMVSNERLGIMNDAKIIDTLLKTDFKDLPQKPRWVDGSGLSRYNLFTPQDLVAILNKMKTGFGMERIKVILPTGGEGTISSYYKADSGYIYAKTGTLSGVVALSGFLYTKKNKLLIFSILVNNHQASATDIRKAEEKFLQEIRSKY